MSSQNKTLTVAYSPCPNDTFIFGAMVHGLVDTEGLSFNPVLDDVESLNRRAEREDVHITKLSYHALGHLVDRYALLNAGSALGRGCGPLLVAREHLDEPAISRAHIAIPGRMTTANFLLGLAYPKSQWRTRVLFSDIEEAVMAGDFDAGLIIHENRFTYARKGLVCIRDLGAFWEQETGFPIPLGGIAVNRLVDHTLWPVVDRVIKRSVRFAFDHPEQIMPYVRANAQAMEDEVMQAHIGLYVNRYTEHLGDDGRAAVSGFIERGRVLGLIPASDADIFVD
jgi:1,4-dihydroxy-6-naphthoate synthase